MRKLWPRVLNRTFRMSQTPFAARGRAAWGNMGQRDDAPPKQVRHGTTSHRTLARTRRTHTPRRLSHGRGPDGWLPGARMGVQVLFAQVGAVDVRVDLGG